MCKKKYDVLKMNASICEDMKASMQFDGSPSNNFEIKKAISLYLPLKLDIHQVPVPTVLMMRKNHLAMVSGYLKWCLLIMLVTGFILPSVLINLHITGIVDKKISRKG